MIIKKMQSALMFVLVTFALASCGVKGDLTRDADHGKKNVPAKSENYKNSDDSSDWVK